MKKTLAVIIATFIIIMSIPVCVNAIRELPEDDVVYVVVCDTCKKKTAYETLPPYETDECSNADCDGIVDFTDYTYGAKEYLYYFDCTNPDCNVTTEYEELPEGTPDAPYGICSCGTVRTEGMFRVAHRYRQYSRPCFYCYKVQTGTTDIYNGDCCPDCGEIYYDVYEHPASVDENGNLIYGGGGDYLYYCSETNKFYEVEEPEDDENVNADCPYCDSHNPLKINVIYSTECNECGARTEYSYLDFFEKPIPLSTLHNALVMIGLDITNGSFDPSEFDISNRCLECGHSFADDKNIVINRHVDAPKTAVYEKHSNDLSYKDTDKYAEEGSEYNNFFEEILFRINYLFNTIKEYVGGWIQLLIYGEVQSIGISSKNEVNTYNLSAFDKIQYEITEN